jgi:hypothetical protein
MFILIVCTSLCLRLWFATHTNFGRDEVAIYNKALDLYLNGVLPTTGAEIVYSGTYLPGALQSLLVGLPLFFTQGMPTGPAYFIALLGLLSTWFTFLLYRKWFPAVNQNQLAAWIFLNPWSIVFTNLWNPSFLPLIGAIFFLNLNQLIEKKHPFWASFWLGACIFLSLQLHLSFVVLVLSLLVLIYIFGLTILSKRGFLLGSTIAGLTLIPYAIELFQKESTSGNFLISNLSITLRGFLDYPSYLLRLLSFSTGETTRFIGRGEGPPATLAYIRSVPLLWIPFFLGISVSAWQIFKALIFFTQFKKMPNQFLVPFWTIILTGFLFGFSIKGPSAHTFWILFPLSFFPFLGSQVGTQHRETPQWLPYLKTSFQKYGLALYLASILAYTFAGMLQGPDTTLADTVRLALESKAGGKPDLMGRHYEEGIAAVMRVLK